MKFRRNKPEPDDAGDASDAEGQRGAGTAAPAGTDAVARPRSEGPWDVSEVRVDEEDPNKVDLGGLVVTGAPGVELRLQVDETSQMIVAVLLVGETGAIELRPFAASRNTDLWDDIRRQIAAEAARHGGTATEVDGAYGKELRVMINVTTPEGPATQPSRVLGISGPRWLLRATVLGAEALEPDHDGPLEKALRDVIVVRGTAPMAPGDPLPLVMPPSAQPLPPES